MLTADVLARYAGFPIPLFITEGSSLCAWPVSGETNTKVIVLSPPKAGTYLVANLMTALGFVSTGLHLMAGHVSDYRFASLDTARNNPYDLSFTVADTALVTDLVQPGQFIVSHLTGTDETEHLCADFVKIMPVREMRETFVSHMRFFADTERSTPGKKDWLALADGPERTVAALRDFGPTHVDMCRAVLGWHGREGVLAIRFEDLWGDKGRLRQHRVVAEVAGHAGVPSLSDDDIEAVLEKTLKQKNKTWSGERTDLSKWWSDEAEDIFVSLGGQELNDLMGYPDPALG